MSARAITPISALAPAVSTCMRGLLAVSHASTINACLVFYFSLRFSEVLLPRMRQVHTSAHV